MAQADRGSAECLGCSSALVPKDCDLDGFRVDLSSDGPESGSEPCEWAGRPKGASGPVSPETGDSISIAEHADASPQGKSVALDDRDKSRRQMDAPWSVGLRTRLDEPLSVDVLVLERNQIRRIQTRVQTKPQNGLAEIVTTLPEATDLLRGVDVLRTRSVSRGL